MNTSSPISVEPKGEGDLEQAQVAPLNEANDADDGDDVDSSEYAEPVVDENWLASWATEVLGTQSEAFFVLGVCLDTISGMPLSDIQISSIIGASVSGLSILITSCRLIETAGYVLKNHAARPKMDDRMSMAVQKVCSVLFMGLSCYLATSIEQAAMRQYSSLMFLVIATFTDMVALVDVWRDRLYYYNCLYCADDAQFYEGKYVYRTFPQAFRHAMNIAKYDTIACIFCFFDAALSVILWFLIFFL
mmetsp:Transcript_17851/g.35246  ORF Transcript_17851/g.35246 Transcript_17851/m.35246 type:complete len:247 (+) Transcript_17851:178-918(+)|eukprot:CAMPEP_0171511388 /NCGR_PEP_ID=MMETSP0959-20130129/963_1 /TAXON_ID=87120 /ORGANISM="Aurantiochytrium limacinum, Strain ATCCMYA-1381" /LENGTH=246 /DNA_ID=CAMNT_0012049001 /DNA_START=144 /DNA_END=884 /DNA_ORIENTATION=-